MILTIAAKDLRTLFLSPLAWVVLALLTLIFAYVFLSQLDAFLAVQSQLATMENAPGVTEVVVAPLFGGSAMVLLMTVPIISMRVLSEERRQQTLTLLMSAPVSMTQIVLGKYLGLMTFLCIIIGLVLAMAASLFTGGTLDTGLLMANFVGLLLLTGSFAALGLYISSLTAHPLLAAIGGIGALLGFWIINLATDDPNSILHYLSLLQHFQTFNRGLVDTADISYFLLFIITFLVLAIRRLDRDRLRG